MANPQQQFSAAQAPGQSQAAGLGVSHATVDSGDSAQLVRESSEQADQSQGFFQQTAEQVKDMAQGAGTAVMNAAQGAGETVKNVAQGTGQTVMNIAHSATETVKNSLGAGDKSN